MAAGPWIPVVIAIALGLYKIGSKSFWLDEGHSVSLSREPLELLISTLSSSELQAAPYYLTLHPWLALGTSEAVVRSLSVVFGAIGIIATYFVGKRYGVAFLAALILAVSPFFIEYEQEARTYTMLVATAALSTLLYLRMVEKPGVARAALYVLSASLIIYVQPLGALVIVSQAIWLFVSVPAPARWRLAAVYPATVIGWVPMLLFAAAHRDELAWMGPTDLSLVLRVATDVAGGTVLLGIVLVMLALGLRRDLPAFALLVPIIGTLAITFLFQPVHQSRYVIAILPAAAIILARNRPVAIAVLLAVSLVGVGTWYRHDEKPDWRGAAAWVSADVQPGDGIVFAPGYLRSIFGYYAHVGDPLNPAVPWTESDLSSGPPDIPGILARSRIWLVEGHGSLMPAGLPEALAAFQAVDVRDYGANGVRVSLLVKPPT